MTTNTKLLHVYGLLEHGSSALACIRRFLIIFIFLKLSIYCLLLASHNKMRETTLMILEYFLHRAQNNGSG